MVFADYFQFYLQDKFVDGDLYESWGDAAIANLIATGSGTVGIMTARNMDVPVKIIVFDSEPEIDDEKNQVDQINECDLALNSGKLVVLGCTDYVPDAYCFSLDNGIYRVRIYYMNLDKLSKDGLDGEDSYLIHLWKVSRKEGSKILKKKHVDV